jgi:hypothetical protein
MSSAARQRVLNIVKLVHGAKNSNNGLAAPGPNVGKNCRPLLVARHEKSYRLWKPCQTTAFVAMSCFAGVCEERLASWELFSAGMGFVAPNCMQLSWPPELILGASRLQLYMDKCMDATYNYTGAIKLTLRYFLPNSFTPALVFYYSSEDSAQTNSVTPSQLFQEALLKASHTTLGDAHVIDQPMNFAPDLNKAPKNTWCRCFNEYETEEGADRQKTKLYSQKMLKSLVDLAHVDKAKKKLELFWNERFPSDYQYSLLSSYVRMSSNDVLFSPLPV